MDTKKLLIGIFFMLIGVAILMRPKLPIALKPAKATKPVLPPPPCDYRLQLFNYNIPPDDYTPLVRGSITYADSSCNHPKIWIDVSGMTLKEVYDEFNNGQLLNP